MITKAVRKFGIREIVKLMNKAVRVLTYDNVNVVFSESLLIPYVFSYFVSHTSDVTVCVECGHECGVPRPRGGKRGTARGRPRCQRCRSGSGVLVARWRRDKKRFNTWCGKGLYMYV